MNEDNNLRKHQLIATEALKQFAQLCDDNNIKYYLLAGSCLGAIRHKGFIPWDDDIDVGIMNDDYRKFERIILDGLSNEYKWISNEFGGAYPRFYGKILHNGVACIDVFRIVRLPQKRKNAVSIWKMRKFLYKVYSRKFGRHFVGESTAFFLSSKLISLFLSMDQIVSLCRWNEHRYKGDGDYINLYSIYSMERETLKKEWLDSFTEVEFEGDSYKTVSNPDEYLTHLYGDYMTPPPEKERNLRHINVEFEHE